MKRMSGVLLLLLFSGVAFAQWEQMKGPRGTAEILYFDDNVAYALTDSSRVYKKTATEESWSYANAGLPGNLIIEQLYVDGDILVAAGQSGAEDKGIFRSADSGSSWSKVVSIPELNFYSIQEAGGTLFAGAINFSGSPLFYSTDNGVTFSASVGVENATQTGGVISFNGKIFVSATDGFYSSSNGGANFTKSTGTGLPQFEALDYLFESSNGNLRAFMFSFSGSKLFESSNEGESWTEIVMSGLGESVNLQACHVISSSIYAIGTASGGFPILYKSTDDGSTWSNVGENTPYAMLQSQTGFGVNSSTFLAGTIAGIFESTDGGATWADASDGLRYNGNVQVQTYVQGTWVIKSGSGIMKNSAFPSGWNDIVTPGQSGNIAILECQGDNIYAYDYAGLYRSADVGQNWDDLTSNLPDGFAVGDIMGTEAKLYITGSANGSQMILVSTDNGENWSQNIVETGYISQLSGNDARLVIASGGSVFESTDGGANWVEYQKNGLPADANINVLKLSGTRVIVYAGDFNQSSVYYTEDNGANWIESDNAGEVGSVKTFETVNGNLLAASETGVFITFDNAETWGNFYYGMGPIEVTSLHSTGKYVLAGTRNHGAWYRPEIQITSLENEGKNTNPEIFSLEQNYPNPFNPSTNIKFTLKFSAYVTLSVYNIAGEEVVTLVSKNLDAGAYNYQFNAAGLSSGVYFYQLQAGNFIDVKKLIFLK